MGDADGGDPGKRVRSSLLSQGGCVRVWLLVLVPTEFPSPGAEMRCLLRAAEELRLDRQEPGSLTVLETHAEILRDPGNQSLPSGAIV